MKNYIGIVRDHSGSMNGLAKGAAKDYNGVINSVKQAAIREGQDTLVYVTKFGEQRHEIIRETVNSSIASLRTMSEHAYVTGGGTPLYDAVDQIITDLQKVPDYADPSVSFVVMVITDGQDEHSTKTNATLLGAKIRNLQGTDRWTFAFRVPKGMRTYISRLGLFDGNIQEWETTEQGLRDSTGQTQSAIDTYFGARSVGATASQSFYSANLQNVSTKEVKKQAPDVTSQVRFFDVGPTDNKRQIRDFMEEKLKATLPLGSAFYPLTKREKEVQEGKVLAVRDKRTKHVFAGTGVRDLLGLPHQGNVNLVPGDHGNFDIFVQSKSVNRALVGGTQVMYWPNAGRGV